MRALLILIFGVVVIGILTGLIFPLIQIPGYFLFGWIFFLKRTLPQVSFNWSGVTLAMLCAALIVLGVHWFCSWLHRQTGNQKSELPKREWSWRWSSGICIGMLLLFSTCIAITGAVHQTGWLIGSNEPLYVRGGKAERFRDIHLMKQQALEITMAAEDNEWNFSKTYSDLSSDYYFAGPHLSLESWNRVYIPGTNGELVAALVFHRDPEKRAKVGFAWVNRETEQAHIHSIEKLYEAMSKYGLNAEGLGPLLPKSSK
jgi:MFS family permease